MTPSKLTLDEYLQYISSSKNKRLLVEGEGDYQFFSRFIEGHSQNGEQIDIDDAGHLIDFGSVLGNREKVEFVYSVVKNEDYSEKLVCFSDRDYREFTLEPSLADDIGCQKIDGRLIWARGHSIENYYFSFAILRDAITNFSTSRYRREALVMIEENFNAILRIATTLSLLGHELDLLEAIRGCIVWQQFELLHDSITFKLDSLEKELISRKKIKENSSFKSRFSHWMTIVEQGDTDAVRWVCHGHIGITVIWASFEGAIFSICQNDEECEDPTGVTDKAIEIKKEIRTATCASMVVHHLRNDESELDRSDYPFGVLNLLDIM